MEGTPVSVPESLDRDSAVTLLKSVRRALAEGRREVVLDLDRVRHADTFGAAGILEARRLVSDRNSSLRLVNVPEDVRGLLAFLRVDEVMREEGEGRRHEGVLERIGEWGRDLLGKAVEQAALHVDCLYLSFVAPFLGRGPRAAHVIHQLNRIGSGSVGIVSLICFLIGLIMALQAAVQMRVFGANIYVANLVGVSMTRELGPLITAIMIAARSGSSIAAELGTMVVTEEIDALKVMAVDSKRYLIAPRFLAMAIALPCLAILADVAGIFGGFLVGVFGLDLSPVSYWNRTVSTLLMSDIVTGLLKSFVFANVIAVVCCHEGITLRGGPEEVGRATTRAVVFSIILVIVADFAFTSIFYFVPRW